MYMDTDYIPKQFVGHFNTATAGKQISTLFQSEFGPLSRVSHGRQCSRCMHIRYVTIIASLIPLLYSYGDGNGLRVSERHP